MARRLVVATAAAVGAGVAVAVVAGGDGDLPPGPMDKPNQHVWGAHAESGVPFTDGLETVVIRGDKEAEIVSIEVDGDDGIETLGYKLVGPEREFGSIQKMKGWPPSDPELDERFVGPAIGAVLQTWSQLGGRGYELLIGHNVDEEGYFVRRGLWITYSVDGEPYRQYFPAVLAICNGVHEGKRSCPAPKGWGDFPAHRKLGE